MDALTVSHLSKSFTFPVKKPEASWITNLFSPQKRTVEAVHDISFSVSQGERIAFIGPNGAGKSTTIKMLTGILHPSHGEIHVLGLDPAKDRKELAYHIGTVFGQRSQLLPNLPLRDSLEFFGVMYDLSNANIKKQTEKLVEIFDLAEFIDQPVRKLSLGQRMRGEVAASLIHKPRIIFLDEPTIGLDVVAKKSLRDLLVRINAEMNTTIFLTSHDVGDIESLCERTLIINHGTLIRDIRTEELARTFVREKYIDVIPVSAHTSFPELLVGTTYLTKQPNKITVSVDLGVTTVTEALRHLLDVFEVADVDVYNADLETVIRHIYENDSTRT